MTTTTTDQTSTPSVSPVSPSVLDQPESEPFGRRIRISLAGAGLLALTGSVVTAIYVRNQARARARELAWFAAMRSGNLAWPGPRQALPLGGAGGALLLLSTLAARRWAMTQAQPQPLPQTPSTPDKPATRDVLLGVALGLGVINALGRARRA